MNRLSSIYINVLNQSHIPSSRYPRSTSTTPTSLRSSPSYSARKIGRNPTRISKDTFRRRVTTFRREGSRNGWRMKRGEERGRFEEGRRRIVTARSANRACIVLGPRSSPPPRARAVEHLWDRRTEETGVRRGVGQVALHDRGTRTLFTICRPRCCPRAPGTS